MRQQGGKKFSLVVRKMSNPSVEKILKKFWNIKAETRWERTFFGEEGNLKGFTAKILKIFWNDYDADMLEKTFFG